VSVKGANLGIVGKGPAEADLRMREIHFAFGNTGTLVVSFVWRTDLTPRTCTPVRSSAPKY
jgi:hypothetical protein